LKSGRKIMTARFLNRTLTIRAARVAALAALMALAFVVMLVRVPSAYADGPSGSETQIDGGSRATCGVTSTGAVHCWGANDYGQAPETVAGSFVQVSAGFSHACAIRTDGTLACWGSNTYPECDPMGGYCHEEYTGQAKPPSGQAKQVAAGAYHTCALQPSGFAECWGKEGDWATDRSGPFSQIAVGLWHNCVIRESDGAAECWGDNFYGQSKPPAGVKFTELAAGENHTCGLMPDGNVACWGGNSWGQAPKQRTGPYTHIAAGDVFTCGQKPGGEIDCWGYNFYGQRNAPDGIWTAFGLGSAFGCASNTQTGVWQCWGWNLYGNAPRNKDLPQQPSPETDLPVVQIFLTPAGPDGANGWYRNPVNVDPQASDDSGIAELRCMLDPPYVPTSFDTLSPEPCAFLGGDVVSGERRHTLYAAAMDPWGNVSEVASISFKIDATPPKLLCPQVQPFLLGSGPYRVGIAVSDFVSGVDEANSTLFAHVGTDAVGPKSATFTALDFAGNSATKECTYSVIYDFGGFYPPVNPAPAVNQAKAGSSVPLKFSLGGDQGLNVIEAGYPASQTVDCSALAPLGESVATKTAGKDGLSYNPGSSWYGYVWKTEKAWAGSCQLLTLKLVDGTEHLAYFQFK
jgi:hypothetical protein